MIRAVINCINQNYLHLGMHNADGKCMCVGVDVEDIDAIGLTI